MNTNLPLEGMSVLDLSWSLPGPFATLYLADLGAEVTRVIPPGNPELFRRMGAMHGECSHAYRYVNRNKIPVVIDLKEPAGKERFLTLLAESDVLVEQFRPGTMARLGLSYAELAEQFPRLIYCSISGYGQNGELSNSAGHDINYLAMSGFAAANVDSSGCPEMLATPVADIAGGGLHGVIGIMSALLYRERTGRGTHVDVSMTDAVLAMNAMNGVAGLNGDEDYPPRQSPLNGGSYYGYYRTSDNRYLALGGLESRYRVALCQAAHREDLVTLARSEDVGDQAAFRAELEAIISSRALDEWCSLLGSLDLCITPVLTPAELVESGHNRERRAIVAVPSPLGEHCQYSHPIRYSAFSPIYRYAGLSPDEVLA